MPNHICPFGEQRALALAALPLSCIDRPHNPPAASHYLYEFDSPPRLIRDYRAKRAFYGCYDWHSAVHAIWTLAVILHRFPAISIGGLIREKLEDHLSASALAGEAAFFEACGSFEMPYGRAWLLKLYADLSAFPEAANWSKRLEPLALKFAADLREFLATLPIANRSGLHSNTAFSMNLVLEYAIAVGDKALREVIADAAIRYFSNDVNAPLEYEPSTADFLSPSLEEAKLMGQVLPEASFAEWLDCFVSLSQLRTFDTRAMLHPDQLPAKSHLIGLHFSRAEALLQCAKRLPPDYPRVPVFRHMAATHGEQGWQDLHSAGYLGSHWLASFALRFELARNGC